MRGILWKWLLFLGFIFWTALYVNDCHRKNLEQNEYLRVKYLETEIEKTNVLLPQKKVPPALTFWKTLSMILSVTALIYIKRSSTIKNCSRTNLSLPYPVAESEKFTPPPRSINKTSVFRASIRDIKEIQKNQLLTELYCGEPKKSLQPKKPIRDRRVGVEIVQKKLESLEKTVATLKQRRTLNHAPLNSSSGIVSGSPEFRKFLSSCQTLNNTTTAAESLTQISIVSSQLGDSSKVLESDFLSLSTPSNISNDKSVFQVSEFFNSVDFSISDESSKISFTKDAKSDLNSVKSDVKSIKSDLKSVKSNVKSAKSNLKVVKPNLKDVKPELKTVKPDLNHFKPDLKDVKPDLKSVKPELNNFKPDLKDVKPEFKNVKPELKNVKSDLNNIKPNLKDVRCNLKIVNSSLKDIKPSLKDIKLSLKEAKSVLRDIKPGLKYVKSDLKYFKSDLKSGKSDLKSAKSSLKNVKSDLKSAKPDSNELKSTVVTQEKDTISINCAQNEDDSSWLTISGNPSGSILSNQTPEVAISATSDPQLSITEVFPLKQTFSKSSKTSFNSKLSGNSGDSSLDNSLQFVDDLSVPGSNLVSSSASSVTLISDSINMTSVIFGSSCISFDDDVIVNSLD